MSKQGDRSPRPSRLPTTQWTLVLAAAGEDPEAAAPAVAALCERYWYPLYVFMRRQCSDAEQARDLTQGFLLSFIEGGYFARVDRNRGRFRNYLLRAAKNYFLNDRRSLANPVKAAQPLEVDYADGERRFLAEPESTLSPDTLFNRQWTLDLLNRVLDELEQEYAARGDGELFACLVRYLDRDETDPPYRDLADELGKSETAVKAAASRLRIRFRDRLRAQVALYTEDGEVDDELRFLFDVLSS